MNILCSHGTFCQLSVWPLGPSINFRAAARAFVNFLCSRGTFHAATGPSANFVCDHRIFHQCYVWLLDLLSTFRMAAGPYMRPLGLSVNFLCGRRTFHQLSVRLRELPSTFCAAWGPSMWPRDFPPILCAAARLSVNSCLPQDFPCSRRTFCQLSVQLQDLPSTLRVAAGPYVNFLYGCGTLCAATGTFY